MTRRTIQRRSDPAEDDNPDSGIDHVPHDWEHEAEVEQMADDVPALPVPIGVLNEALVRAMQVGPLIDAI